MKINVTMLVARLLGFNTNEPDYRYRFKLNQKLKRSLYWGMATSFLICALFCRKEAPVEQGNGFEAGPILFVSDKSGTWQLYSMNEDGSDVKQLTNDPNFPITDARWSPDGSKIVFTSRDDRIDPQQKSSALYIMNADGTGRYKLTNPPIEAFSYPADGSPVWSPDGKRIAFARLMPPEIAGETDVFVVNLDSKNERQLTSNRNLTEHPAGWTPDGLYLLVEYGDYLTGKSQIALLDFQGNYVRTLTHPDSSDRSPVFSPDGKSIVFTSREGNLHLMDEDGHNRRRLTEAVFLQFAVDFSADGSRILYNSWDKPTPGNPFENDPWNIVIIDTTGTKLVQITPFDYRQATFYATSWRRR